MMDGKELYLRYRDKVLFYIRARVENEQDAEDLCSTVFMKAWAHLPDYDGQRSSVSTWLFSIARNAVIDFYRARRPTAELDETVPVPERDMELEALADALEALSERERDVIVLDPDAEDPWDNTVKVSHVQLGDYYVLPYGVGLNTGGDEPKYYVLGHDFDDEAEREPALQSLQDEGRQILYEDEHLTVLAWP